jgi:hypothetical protein
MFPTSHYDTKDAAQKVANEEQFVFQSLRFYAEAYGTKWVVACYNEDGKLKGYL